METRIRTINFLPDIFKTPTNRQFLGATLDQIVDQPNTLKIEGFVGSKFGYGVNANDKYVIEPTKTRRDYQLEPGVVFTKKDSQVAQDFISYPGIIDAIKLEGGITDDNDRLFNSQFYSWDPFINLDMLINFNQYYWLPTGAPAVTVSGDINVLDDILGKENYTSPGVVVFTNGLKVQFSGTIFPAEYQTGQYYVQGVGTAIELLPVESLVTPEAFTESIYNPYDITPYDIGNYDQQLYIPVLQDYITIARNSIDKNPWSRSNRWFHIDVINATAEYNNDPSIATTYATIANKAKRPIIEFYPNLKLFDTGIIGKAGVDFIDFRTTDAFTQVAGQENYYPDVEVYTAYTATIPASMTPTTSITISIPTADIVGTFQIGQYVNDTSNVTPYAQLLPNNAQITAIDAITVPGTTTLSVAWPTATVIAGASNISISGDDLPNTNFSLFPGARVVFANDTLNKNKIYVAQFSTITPSSTPIITLTIADDGNVLPNEQTVAFRGYNNQGKDFYYSDVGSWVESQQKVTVNQPPLFDVFDKDGISFGDKVVYVGTSFKGTTLFQYGRGSGLVDTILGFPIRYSSESNQGDISFDVTFNSDTFNYISLSQPRTENINTGYVYNFSSIGSYTRQLGWQTAVAPSRQYQIFSFDYKVADQTTQFVCDIPAAINTVWPNIQVYINNVLTKEGYTTAISLDSTIITFTSQPSSIDTQIQISIISDQVSKTAYYEVPINLTNNPLNQNPVTVNVGDIRGQYQSIFYNNPYTMGKVFGANNYRDLGNMVPWGNRIIQNSASLVLPGVFSRKQNQNLIHALQYNSEQYITYKNLLIDTINNTEYSVYQTPASILDDAIDQITSAKFDSAPFFWSDMLPSKAIYASNSYTFANALDTSNYPLSKIYDFDKANYNGVLVYLTRSQSTYQLIKGVDYTVSETSPSLTVTLDLLPNDIITINEYNQTYGSYVPNTPTKLGLYPSFIPGVVLDENYTQPTYFIKGHDGSYTKLYGDYIDGKLIDFRDKALLEFETRIYNNLKLGNTTPYVIPIRDYDVIPGFFRTTDYTYDEVLSIYSQYFLNWAGQNRIDFATQKYNSTNQFTYNYNQSGNKIYQEALLQGYWRGIYQYFYDTSTPDTAPWEMLFFTSQPSWWETRYGPAPYTSDNLVLWGDLAAGINWNNGNPVVIPQAVRPELLQVIPVDSAGNLLSPFDAVMGNYNQRTFRNDWKVGDVGPAEFSYRRSSSWPFDLMKILALTKPAEFYNLGVDLDNYRYNEEFNQFLVNDRSHLVIDDIQIYGSGIPKTSYINWIVDYEKQVGIDATTNITELLYNLDVRLVYRLAGFSDKTLLKFFVEKGTPNSRNASLLIPDESYSVLLYENQPNDRIIYSSVIVQKTTNGWRVFGNSQNKAYFVTKIPKINSNYNKIVIEDLEVQIAKDYYKDSSALVPYGQEFYTIQTLSQFIVSYGNYLIEQGMLFDQIESGLQVDWTQMVAELLYWVQSGWEVGSIVNLNPAANTLIIDKESHVVQPLTLQRQNFVLNQNLYPIQSVDLAVLRDGTAFTATPLNEGDTVAYGQFNLSNIEHGIVFDNVTLFNDTLYNLVTGLKQNRVYLRGTKSAEWNGTIDAQGFILNQDNILEWSRETKYTKGAIVKYKNKYWTSIKIVQAKEIFDETDWIQTDYNEIQKGLLPNSSTRSYESTLYYNVNKTNLESDADLLSFSLIGYRPRDYLALADLTDITQVNVYKNLIREKGTRIAVNLFKGAQLPQGGIDYEVYENWAIKTGEFGGVLNSNFVDFKLNQSDLTANPSIVGLTDGQYTSGVQQNVPIYSIINYGRPVSSANVLPTLPVDTPPKLFSSAGYANFNDVKVYSYYYSGLGSAEIPLSELYVGEYVWIADYQGTWQVYTPVSIGQVINVVNNLNGTATVQFNKPHNLSKFQPLAIISFDASVDGYYIANSIVAIDKITISLALNPAITNIPGQGVAVKFQTARVSKPSDIPNLPLTNTQFVKNKVWVDENNDGNWGVYRKSINYSLEKQLEKTNSVSFGSAVAYTEDLGYLLSDASLGEVYRYTFNAIYNEYVLTQIISTAIDSFGTAIEHAGSTVVISQPNNTPAVYVYKLEISLLQNELVQQQIITAPVGITNWGSAIAISGDEQWLFISAVDSNLVYVYFKSQVTGEYQLSTTLTLGSLVAGDKFGSSISTDYYGSTVVISAPNKDFDSTTDNWGYTYVFDRLVQSFEALDPQAFNLIFSTNNIQIGVTSSSSVTDEFTCSSTESLSVGTPVVFTGAVFGGTINANVTYFVSNISSATKFSVSDTLGGSTINLPNVPFGSMDCYPQVYNLIVSKNGLPLNNTEYSAIGNQITLYGSYTIGDIVTVSGTNFVFNQTLTTETTPRIGVQFGKSVDTNNYGTEILVGAPFEINEDNQEGAVYRFTNEGGKYGTITGTAPCNVTSPTTILLNGYAVAIPTGNAAVVANAIVQANITNITAAASNGNLVISVINVDLATINDKLSLSVLNTSVLSQLGITPFTQTQVINDVNPQTRTQFGTVVKFNEFGSFIVSAPVATRYSNTTFDFNDDGNYSDDTIFDNNTTQWVDDFVNAGAVYMYDYLSVYNENINNVGKFVYAQSVNAIDLEYGAQPYYGTALEFYQNKVLVGTPNFEPGFINGQVIVYDNPYGVQDWKLYRYSAPIVDVEKITNTQLYSASTNNTLINLDYIDPLQGKILGVVKQNLDIVSNVDPAQYNSPNAQSTGGAIWGSAQVGKLWFDTSTTKFVNYHQNDDVVYNSKWWGIPFPGSDAKVYSWVASNVLPISYTGPGTPLDFNSYSIEYKVISTGALVPVYFYWVRNTNIVFSKMGKTLSDTICESYIESPIATGISYLAPIQPNIFGLYNTQEYVNARDTVLHLGFATGNNDDVSHSSYTLIQSNNPDDFLPGLPGDRGVVIPESLYDRQLDSLSGVDEAGAVVPDPYLPKPVQSGIYIRPRQSFFYNRFRALENYIKYANEVLKNYPITETTQFPFLFEKNPIVYGSVNDGLVNATEIKKGYKYKIATLGTTDFTAIGAASNTVGLIFVANDSNPTTQAGAVIGSGTGTANWILFEEGEKYNTQSYWNYTYWWAEGYNNNTKSALLVPLYANLSEISNPQYGLIVTVAQNGNGNQEVYRYQYDAVVNGGVWTRIGLQNGTIQFKDTLWNYSAAKLGFGENFFDVLNDPFDNYPSTETRYIVRALNEQIYVQELLEYRNKSLILLFDYITSETIESQNYLPWLNKTSFIDVAHTIRELLPLQVFKSDNQDFLAGYINEAKPYHVVIKDFTFKYTGQDVWGGTVTDFDLPASYDANIGQFVSPMMAYDSISGDGQYLYTDSIWNTKSYSEWYNNYGLSFSGQNSYPITTLASYVSLASDSLFVANAQGLPVRGQIAIRYYNPELSEVQEEKIGYTGVDYSINRLYGLFRGADDTDVAIHYPGAEIFIDLPGVVVVNSGRGYTTTPNVTAKVNLSAFPAPTVYAEFEAVMENNKVIGINVINSGEGYYELPEIEIDPAFSVTFTSDDVDTNLNIVGLNVASLETGDLVKFTTGTGTNAPIGLTENQYYYVGVLQSVPSDVIAFYYTLEDAVYDFNRVELQSQGSGSNNIISVTAKAFAVTNSQPVRENIITLRFDRTSYTSKIVPWEAGQFYGSYYAGLYVNSAQISSSSITLETTEPNVANILSSAQGSALEIQSISNNNVTTWSSLPRLVANTFATGNIITLESTANGAVSSNTIGPTTGFYVGMPIQFTGNIDAMTSNIITTGNIYYVSNISSLSNITISSSVGGTEIALTDASANTANNEVLMQIGEVVNTGIITINYPGILNVTETDATNNSLFSPLTPTGQGGTTNMYIGVPVFCANSAAGNVFGNITENEPYYVSTILDSQRFILSKSNTAVILNAKGANAANNTIILAAGSTTNDLSINDPLIFQNMIYPSGNLIVGQEFTITNVGSTDFTQFGATANVIGTQFTANGTGLVSSVLNGLSYTIQTLGDAAWTSLGASANAVGTTFTANTNSTLGTGVAIQGNGTASSQTFGGIVSGNIYYVNSIANLIAFTVSESINGLVFSITNDATANVTITNQSDAVELTTATGNMTLNIGSPLSPGQINGQLFDFYATSGNVTSNVTGTIGNLLTRTINSTVAETDSLIISNSSGGLNYLYTGLQFNVSQSVGGLNIGTDYTITGTGNVEILGITGVVAPGSNNFACGNTVMIYQGMPVTFSGIPAGGISIGQEYYIKTIVPNVSFSLSEVKYGNTLPLTSDVGLMNLLGEPYITINNGLITSSLTTEYTLTQSANVMTPVPTFNVGYMLGGYIATIEEPSKNFVVNNTITIDGALIGGVTGTSNLTITVNEVDSTGAITNISKSGTPPGNSGQYYLKVISANECEVYADHLFTLPVSGIELESLFDGVTITSVTNTSSVGNLITVPSGLSDFNDTDVVVFTGDVFGGVTIGKPYFITKVSATTATISETLNGTPITLTSESGSMTMAKSGSFAFLPEPFYFDQSIVTYKNKVYRCVVSNNDTEFQLGKWELVQSDSRDLNALDRIQGYYQPTVNMPGKDMAQLVTGITYPNATYLGNPFAPEDQLTLDTELSDLEFAPVEVDNKSIVNTGNIFIGVSNQENYSATITSTTGASWALQKLSESPIAFTDIVYGNAKFVITTNNSATPVLVSTNAVDWYAVGQDTPNTSIVQQGLNSVAYYGNSFIAVGSTGNILASADANNWSTVYSNSSQSLYGVSDIATTGFTGFVAVGETSGNALILSSTNLVTWTDVSPISATELFGAASGNDIIVTVGSSGNIFHSTNAVAWTQASVSNTNANLHDVTYGNGVFVAVGETGNIVTSLDGNVWDDVGLAITANLNGVTYNSTSGKYVAVGENNTILESTDANTWTVITQFVQPITVYDVQGDAFLSGYGPEELVPGIVSDNLSMIVTTRPGTTWNVTVYEHVGYKVTSLVAQTTFANQTEFSFEGAVQNPAELAVFLIDNSTGLSTRLNQDTLTNTYDYTIDWVNKNVVLNSPLSVTNSLQIDVYEVGNGDQLVKSDSDNDPVFTNESTGFGEIILNCNYSGGRATGSGVVIPSTRPTQVEAFETDSANNQISCASVSSFTLNSSITFQGDVFGGMVDGTVYYVKTINYVTNQISISDTVNAGIAGPTFALTDGNGSMQVVIQSGNGIVWTEPAVLHNGKMLTLGEQSIISETKADGTIICNSTSQFVVGEPIVFSKDINSFGTSIVSNQTYYIQSIIDSYQFTISATVGGPVITLVNATGIALCLTSDYAITMADNGISAKIVLSNSLFTTLDGTGLPVYDPTVDFISYTVFGESEPIQYGYTLPQHQVFTGNTDATYDLVNFVGGVNAENAIVELDGLRITSEYSIDTVTNSITFTGNAYTSVSSGNVVSVTTFNDTNRQYFNTQYDLTGNQVNQIVNIDNNISGPLAITTCTATSLGTNEITCTSTAGFVLNQTVTFTGTTGFGNINTDGTVYYVKSIVSGTKFTISATNGGPTFVLAAGTGSMTAYVGARPAVRVTTASAHGFATNDIVRIDGVLGSTQLNNNTYYVHYIDANTVDLYNSLYASNDPVTVVSSYTGGGYIWLNGTFTIVTTTANVTTSTSNFITVANRDHLVIDTPVYFSGNVFGGVVSGNTYYIKDVVDYITTVTTSNAATNLFSAESTTGFEVDLPIVFTGNVFGGISTGTTYYIENVVSSTNFTISSTPGGMPMSLTDAIGTMIATVSTNYITITEERGGTEFALSTANGSMNLTQWEQLDPQRVYVTVNGYRVPSSSLKFNPNNDLSILTPITTTDSVTITSMIPSATPNEMIYIQNVNKSNNASVYRINSEDKTWLTQALYDTDPTIYVDNVAKLTAQVVQNESAPAPVDGIITIGLSANKNAIVQIIIVNNSTGFTLSSDNYSVNLVNIAPVVEITDGVSTGDNLTITIIEGNLLYINGEQIKFTNVDFANNTISGLSRGVNGTGVNNYLPAYTQVLALLPNNLLPTADYDKTWNSNIYNKTEGDPLQISETPAAIFLNSGIS